jgi:hypothetical protein
MTTSHHDARLNRVRRLACSLALGLLSLIACGSASAGWKYIPSTPCWDTVAQVAAFYVSQHTGIVNGYSTNFTLTSVNETTGAYGGMWTATLIETGVTGAAEPWSDQALSCVADACTAGSAGFHRGVVAGEKVNPFNTCYANCLTSAVPRLDLGTLFRPTQRGSWSAKLRPVTRLRPRFLVCRRPALRLRRQHRSRSVLRDRGAFISRRVSLPVPLSLRTVSVLLAIPTGLSTGRTPA